MAKVLESQASAQTSYVGEVGSISSGNLSTAQMSQANVNLEIPDGGTKGIVTLDFDEIINDTAAPEADGAPSSFGDISTNQMSASHDSSGPDTGGITGSGAGANGATPIASGGASGAMSAGSVDVSASVSFDGGGAGSIGSGDASTGSHGDGSEIGGGSANGIDGRMVYSDDAIYEGPEFATSDADIEIQQLLSLDPEVLKDLIGQMNETQFKEFILGVQAYYQHQIDNLTQLLANMEPFYKELYSFCRELEIDNSISEIQISIDSFIVEQIGYVQLGMKDDVLEAAGITLEQFFQLTEEEKKELLRKYDPAVKQQLEDLDERMGEIDKLVEEKYGDLGIHTYEQLKETVGMLESSIAETKQSIAMLNNYKNSAEYDYLLFSKDYSDYEYRELSDDIKNAVLNSLAMAGDVSYYDFTAFHQQYPDVSPLEYLQVIYEKDPSFSFTIQGIKNLEALEIAVQAMPYLPDYAKTFAYLYEQDPNSAYEFLEKTKYQLNNIAGQLRAQQFLSSLYEKGGNYDFLGAIENELGVSLKGLIDGLDSYVDGVGYSFEALISLFTKDYNRQLSADDYEKMYILYGLMSTEAKLKNGLILDNGDGTYSNNPDPNVNPYGIIDFSKDFAGLFLSNNYEISQGIGNMLPSIALSSVCPAAGMWSLGISAGGNAYHNAMVNNNDYYSSVIYGIFSGLSEAATERLFGGIPFLSDVKVTSWKTLFQAMGREFTQESLQGVMDLFARRDFLGEELPDLDDIEAWKEIGLDLLKQGGYGAITAGILQSPSFAITAFNLSNVNNFMNENKIRPEEQQEALDQLRDAHPEFADLSDADIRIQYGQQLAAQAMLNKTAQENNVSVDVAKVMLAFSIDAPTASYMMENGCSLEEAINAMNPVNPYSNLNFSKQQATITNVAAIANEIIRLANNKRANLTSAIESLLTTFATNPSGRNYYDLRLICSEAVKLLKNNGYNNAGILVGNIFRGVLQKIGFDSFQDPATGIQIHLLKGLDWVYQQNTIDSIMIAVAQLPPDVRACLKDIYFYDTFNPDDFYWADEYQQSFFSSAATGGRFMMELWANNVCNLTVVAHEAAHTLDEEWTRKFGIRQKYISLSPMWIQAAQADFKTSGEWAVTPYSRQAYYSTKTFREDFAEAVAMFYTDPNSLDKYPARKALLMKILPQLDHLTMAQAYDQIYDILVNKYGKKEALERLQAYYNDPSKLDVITRDSMARYLMGRFTHAEFKAYIDSIVAKNTYDNYRAMNYNLNIYFEALSKKYGYEKAVSYMQAFVNTGDVKYLGIQSLGSFTIHDYRNFIRAINNGSLDVSSIF